MFQSSPSGRRETAIIFLKSSSPTCFNPLPPGGGRLTAAIGPSALLLFQSSPSGRRETPREQMLCPVPAGFNPLPPGGGRPPRWRPAQRCHGLFQSSPSGRRETRICNAQLTCFSVSILSLRAEGDRRMPRLSMYRISFNPLPPGGGRHQTALVSVLINHVSILSLRAEGDNGVEV